VHHAQNYASTTTPRNDERRQPADQCIGIWEPERMTSMSQFADKSTNAK